MECHSHVSLQSDLDNRNRDSDSEMCSPVQELDSYNGSRLLNGRLYSTRIVGAFAKHWRCGRCSNQNLALTTIVTNPSYEWTGHFSHDTHKTLYRYWTNSKLQINPIVYNTRTTPRYTYSKPQMSTIQTESASPETLYANTASEQNNTHNGPTSKYTFEKFVLLLWSSSIRRWR